MKTAFIGTAAISITGFIIIHVFPQQIVSIFTKDPELLPLAARALELMMALLPLIILQILSATFFQAIGKAGPAILLSISREFLFLMPTLIILPRILQLDGVWLAFPAADLLAAILSAYLFWPALKKIRNCIANQSDESPLSDTEKKFCSSK